MNTIHCNNQTSLDLTDFGSEIVERGKSFSILKQFIDNKYLSLLERFTKKLLATFIIVKKSIFEKRGLVWLLK